MKPFNLKEALEGKPVVMRNGEKVTAIYHLKERKNSQKIIVYTDNSNIETLHNENGNYYRDNCPSPFDLFMYEEPTKMFINIYKTKKNNYFAGMLRTEGETEDFVGEKIKTIEITI